MIAHTTVRGHDPSQRFQSCMPSSHMHKTCDCTNMFCNRLTFSIQYNVTLGHTTGLVAYSEAKSDILGKDACDRVPHVTYSANTFHQLYGTRPDLLDSVMPCWQDQNQRVLPGSMQPLYRGFSTHLTKHLVYASLGNMLLTVMSLIYVCTSYHAHLYSLSCVCRARGLWSHALVA